MVTALLYVAATTDPFILGVVTTALGGGAISALAAFKRTKPQGQLDIANASKVLFEQVNTDNTRLRAENDRLHRENERVKSIVEDQHEINQRMLEQVGRLTEELQRFRAT